MGASLTCCNFKNYFKSSDVAIDYPDELVSKIKAIVRIQKNWRKHQAIVKKRKLTNISKKTNHSHNTFNLLTDVKPTKNAKVTLNFASNINEDLNNKSIRENSIGNDTYRLNCEFKSKDNLDNYLRNLSFVNIKNEGSIKQQNILQAKGDEALLTFFSDEPEGESNKIPFNKFSLPGVFVSPKKIKEKTELTIIDREHTLDKFSLDDKSLQFLSKHQAKLRKYTIQYDDESIYSGTFNENWERHGFGVFLQKDGSKYIGFFKKNKIHGKGRLIDTKGNYYEGFFKNDMANGYGKFVNANGDIYIGYWVNDKHHGKGEEFFKDGSRYEGSFKNDVKEGKGRFVYPDGTSYEGEFLNDLMHGKGVYRLGEGKIYSGDFYRGKMEGTGVFIWPDKKKYIGQYNKDKKHGFGIFIWPEGKRYEGEWSNGKQHGYGVYYSNNIKKYGYWENGIKQNWVDEAKCIEVMKKIQTLKLNDIQSVSNLSKSSYTSI